jgi:quercetin dioxygenase-like cupin family protein
VRPLSPLLALIVPGAAMNAGRWMLGFAAAAAVLSYALGQQISSPLVKQEEILRRTSNTWNKPFIFPSRMPEVTATIIEYPPGTSGERQINPYSRYIYILEGTLTLDVDGRGPVDFPAGSLILSGSTWLIPKNNGTVTARLLVIDQTEAGKSNVLFEK